MRKFSIPFMLSGDQRYLGGLQLVQNEMLAAFVRAFPKYFKTVPWGDYVIYCGR